MKPISLAGIGALTGLLSVFAIALPLGEFPAVALFGQCIGGVPIAGQCSGLSFSLYVFPGLIFGLAVGIALRRAGRLNLFGYALSAMVAHALAVVVTLSALGPLGGVLPDDAALSVAGIIGGALGAGVLTRVTGRWLALSRAWIPTAVGTALGALLPIFDKSMIGEIAFYVVWQAGYGAALAARLRVPPAAG
jgi:hypothetical protein